MSSHLRMADEFSRMATQFQSQSQSQSQSAPATSATTRFPQNTEQARDVGGPSTGNRSAMWSFMGSFNAADGGGRWVSESRSESWVNGQRRTTHKRRDTNVRHFINSPGFSFLFFSFLFLPFLSFLFLFPPFLPSLHPRYLLASIALPPTPGFFSSNLSSRATNRKMFA